MILDSVRAALAAHFLSSWTATRIAWPNEKPLELRGVPWVRFSVVPYLWTVPFASAPDRTGVLSGDVILQVFVPSGSGAGVAAQLADTAALAFSAFTDDDVVCYEAHAPVIRGDDGHGWYQVDVVIPFRAGLVPAVAGTKGI